jgi:hypothetical protein
MAADVHPIAVGRRGSALEPEIPEGSLTIENGIQGTPRLACPFSCVPVNIGSKMPGGVI